MNIQLITVTTTKNIPEGHMKGFTVADEQILIANVAGTFYAMDAVCSHMHGYLPAGTLINNIVICPVHRAQYDVTTGKVHKNVAMLLWLASKEKAENLHTYQIVVERDEINLWV